MAWAAAGEGRCQSRHSARRGQGNARFRSPLREHSSYSIEGRLTSELKQVRQVVGVREAGDREGGDQGRC